MKHSFLKLTLLFILGLLLFSNCAEKGRVVTVSKKDPQDVNLEPEMRKVEFRGGLENSLDVIQIIQGKADGDLLHVQVELKNISSKEVMLTHKLEWLDQEGFLVKDTSLVWIALMIRPGESKMIQSISSRSGVTTFRLKVQPAKNS